MGAHVVSLSKKYKFVFISGRDYHGENVLFSMPFPSLCSVLLVTTPLLKVLFLLFEHAAGYAIFRCRDVEDIGSLLPEVQAAMEDFSLFSAAVSLEAFSPFKTGVNALENINSVSEGMVGGRGQEYVIADSLVGG